jgi:hypothetical protein
MSVNVFGQSLQKSDTAKKYVDTKFISLVKKLHLKLDKTVQEDLDMKNHKITNVGVPFQNMDAVNKEYADLNFTALNNNIESIKENRKLNTIQHYCAAGLIPLYLSTQNNAGFTVNTSSSIGTNHGGYKVLNPTSKTCWRVATGSENFWIEIECSFKVTIYRFMIQLAENTKFLKWKIQGAMDRYHLWEDLLFNLEPLLNNNIKVFTLDSKLAKGYWIYRLFIEEAEGTDPGINYWQLYAFTQPNE